MRQLDSSSGSAPLAPRESGAADQVELMPNGWIAVSHLTARYRF
jgi:hypothetical protein